MFLRQKRKNFGEGKIFHYMVVLERLQDIFRVFNNCLKKNILIQNVRKYKVCLPFYDMQNVVILGIFQMSLVVILVCP